MHAIRTAVALAGLCLAAGCTASHGGPTRSPAIPTRSSSPSAARSTDPDAPDYRRYVPASKTSLVRIVPVPSRFAGTNGHRIDDSGIPEHLTVGRSTHVVFEEYRGDRNSPPVGVTVGATHASVICAAPFLAEPGHGYLASCDVTATKAGPVTLFLAEHDQHTGARTTYLTIPLTAR